MKATYVVAVLCLALALFVGRSACASGEWYWFVTPNPANGTLNYSGTVGGSALSLTARIVNSDHANDLIFDGVTLKADELTPNDTGLFDGLWTMNPAVEIPNAFTVAPGSCCDFTLGQFNLSAAVPGVYKFKLTSAVEYSSVAAYPDQANSSLLTVEVLPVPEPATVVCLAMSLVGVGLAGSRRLRLPRR